MIMKYFPVWGHILSMIMFLVGGEFITAWFCFAAAFFALLYVEADNG